jgi:hypothetical protein
LSDKHLVHFRLHSLDKNAITWLIILPKSTRQKYCETEFLI